MLALAWLASLLSGVNGASPLDADASESAVNLVEVALGRYSPGLITDWGPPDGFDAVEAASRMPDAPNVWTDGGCVLDQVTGVSSCGAGRLQSVQRAEMWGVILALQSSDAVHFWVWFVMLGVC